ncbi:hypothetical protein [Thiomonas sp. FB-Cd]|uniref:hypothetical protein n=1 Tax=Thiomonas sp. FB-Cd TaxID=1158292 RepID=UPI00350F87BB
MTDVPTSAVTPAALAELMSAPATAYMSPEQLAFFRALLCAERDALLRAAQETTDHLQVLEPTPDPSDRASLEHMPAHSPSSPGPTHSVAQAKPSGQEGIKRAVFACCSSPCWIKYQYATAQRHAQAVSQCRASCAA